MRFMPNSSRKVGMTRQKKLSWLLKLSKKELDSQFASALLLYNVTYIPEEFHTHLLFSRIWVIISFKKQMGLSFWSLNFSISVIITNLSLQALGVVHFLSNLESSIGLGFDYQNFPFHCYVMPCKRYQKPWLSFRKQMRLSFWSINLCYYYKSFSTGAWCSSLFIKSWIFNRSWFWLSKFFISLLCNAL